MQVDLYMYTYLSNLEIAEILILDHISMLECFCESYSLWFERLFNRSTVNS